MIDAATIGITLALNNGVSDGIALIRRELTALDAAVAVSSAGLTQLAALAAGSWLAAPERIAPASLPALSRPAAVPAAVLEPSATQDPGPAGPAAPVPSTSVDAPPAASRAPDMAAPANTPGPARVPIAATEGSAPSRAIASDVAQFAAFGRALAVAPVEPARARAVAAAELEAPAMANELAMPLAPIGPVTSPLTTDGGEPIPAARAPIAPLAERAPTLLQPAAPPASSSPWERATEPRAEHQDAIEISLDGAVLARWLSAELASQATRPPAGATLFDPRLSPAWPGIAGTV